MTNTAMLEKIISESGYKKNYIAKAFVLLVPLCLSKANMCFQKEEWANTQKFPTS